MRYKHKVRDKAETKSIGYNHTMDYVRTRSHP